jgi:hypothetical protein
MPAIGWRVAAILPPNCWLGWAFGSETRYWPSEALYPGDVPPAFKELAALLDEIFSLPKVTALLDVTSKYVYA